MRTLVHICRKAIRTAGGKHYRFPMRWLLIVLIVSVCALVVASGGMALHIWRQRPKLRRPATDGDRSDLLLHGDNEIETEEAP